MMKTEMPLVSIIIPVYNVEKYLKRCILSILKQSYSNWELILVDDGSVDSSNLICDNYAKSNNKLRVFHKKNGGVSSARNIGLNYAQGQWITFIDSDDWVDSDYLCRLVSCIQDDVDLIVSGYESECGTDCNVSADYSKLISGKTACYTVPWGKLYRASIIADNRIRFLEEMRLGEDAVFLYTYMTYSRQVRLIEDIGYHYNIEAVSSLSKRIFPLKNELFASEQIVQAIDKFVECKNIVDKAAIERLTMLKVFFVKRVLDALYYNKVPKNVRLVTIKQVDTTLYSKNLMPGSWQEAVFICLIGHKCYRSYDLLRTCVVFWRRILGTIKI